MPPDLTVARAQIALTLMSDENFGDLTFDEEQVTWSLVFAEELLRRSYEITLQSEREVREAHIARVNALLGPIPPNQEKKL